MRRSTKVVVGLTSVALIAGAACKPGAPDPAFGDHGTVAVAGVTGERRLYPTADGGTLVGGPIPLVALGPDGVRHDDLALGVPPGCIGWDTLERDGDGFVGLCRGAAGPLGVARTSADGTPDLAFGDDGVAPPPVEMPAPGRRRPPGRRLRPRRRRPRRGDESVGSAGGRRRARRRR